MSPPKSSEINGPRPSPLLIHKDSHLIRKPQLRQPVIIYTHSPKIIHTQPKDFMALVQRLTGFNPPPLNDVGKPSLSFSERNLNDNDSSSGITTEEEMNEYGGGDKKQSMVLKGVMQRQRQSNSNLLRYSSDFTTTPFSSPALLNSLSPSFMEFLKALPEF